MGVSGGEDMEGEREEGRAGRYTSVPDRGTFAIDSDFPRERINPPDEWSIHTGCKTKYTMPALLVFFQYDGMLPAEAAATVIERSKSIPGEVPLDFPGHFRSYLSIEGALDTGDNRNGERSTRWSLQATFC